MGLFSDMTFRDKAIFGASFVGGALLGVAGSEVLASTGYPATSLTVAFGTVVASTALSTGLYKITDMMKKSRSQENVISSEIAGEIHRAKNDPECLVFELSDEKALNQMLEKPFTDRRGMRSIYLRNKDYGMSLSVLHADIAVSRDERTHKTIVKVKPNEGTLMFLSEGDKERKVFHQGDSVRLSMKDEKSIDAFLEKANTIVQGYKEDRIPTLEKEDVPQLEKNVLNEKFVFKKEEKPKAISLSVKGKNREVELEK